MQRYAFLAEQSNFFHFFLYFVSFCSTNYTKSARPEGTLRPAKNFPFYVIFLRKNLRKCLVVSDIFCNFVSGNKGKIIARKQTPNPLS